MDIQLDIKLNGQTIATVSVEPAAAIAPSGLPGFFGHARVEIDGRPYHALISLIEDHGEHFLGEPGLKLDGTWTLGEKENHDAAH